LLAGQVVVQQATLPPMVAQEHQAKATREAQDTRAATSPVVAVEVHAQQDQTQPQAQEALAVLV
jgi:hypothetical protein